MKNQNNSKIQIDQIPFKKLMILLTLILIIGITAFYYAMRNKVIKDSKTQTISMVKSLAKQKDMMLTNTINHWYIYADTVAALCVGDNDEFVYENIKKLDELDSPYVIAFDQTGNKISSQNSHNTVNHDMYYERVMAGERIVTDIIEEDLEGSREKIVAVAVPMKTSDGTVVGGIVCAYKIADIKDIIASEDITALGETIIIDQNERIIVGNGQHDLETNFFDLPKEDKFYLEEDKKREVRVKIERKQSNFVQFGEGRNNRLFVYECNMTSEWTVVTMVDRDALELHSYNITKNLLLTLMGAIVFAVIMYIIIFLLYIVIIKTNNERSKKLKEEKAKLTYIAMRDSMTGLYNKKTAIDMIMNLINDNKETKKHALFFVDIDNFKTVNDRFGHDEGDQLIVLFAKIMEEHFRVEDIVARFGGDEFVILVKDYGNEESLMQMAERLCNLIYAKSKEKVEYEFSTSIGIAVYPEHGTTCEELLKNADKALYWSKKEGKNQYHIYDDEKVSKIL